MPSFNPILCKFCKIDNDEIRYSVQIAIVNYQGIKAMVGLDEKIFR